MNAPLKVGVLYDFVHTSGRLGYSSTVFLTNLFLLPDTEEAFLAQLARLLMPCGEWGHSIDLAYLRPRSQLLRSQNELLFAHDDGVECLVFRESNTCDLVRSRVRSPDQFQI